MVLSLVLLNQASAGNRVPSTRFSPTSRGTLARIRRDRILLAASSLRFARTHRALIPIFCILLSATPAWAATWKPPVHAIYWPHSLAGCSLQKLRTLAHDGDPAAENALGDRYLHGQGVKQDWKKAVFWCHKAALAGNAKGAFNLAFAYNFGEGVPQNTHKAVYWWQQSAKDYRRPS
ncbi:sel1 repeat family protein [Acidithiobacillus ferrooxidans]|nr:tetratricopeptide repeat protein [Acidithiobacillus ferrooxidans]MBU2855421.1 sel1 repeat family protein [Acidithiobacillus ferrooxidans]MBU2861437.1 sel1 repeat family protein [Acidithiobacillus ferrooxidans]